MTTNTVSQAGVEVLFRPLPAQTISQAGVEVLFRINTPMTVSQIGVEVLHRVIPVFSITQAGVEVLSKYVPCTTSFAQIWTITRVDGEVFRFTSLDRAFPYQGNIYQACDSLVPSASESVSELDAAGNMDLSGAIGPDGITQEDLYAGLFDGAQVEAWLVPWQGDGVRKLLIKSTFGPVEQSDTGFKAELLGDGAKLQQTPLISTLQPGCRWRFGDPITCGKDLAPLTVTGTIDSALSQREFTDAARAEPPGYFKRGEVTFTTGANSGVTAEIKEHEVGGVFTLWPRLPFPIVVGDQYSMTPGCTNLKTAEGGCNGCEAWGQQLRYGGEDKVPTGDKRTAAANVR